MKRLNMKNPEVISLTPDKPNLKYILRDKPKTIEEALLPIVENIRHHQLPPNYNIIIFCRKYDECSMMYRLSQNWKAHLLNQWVLLILLDFGQLTCFVSAQMLV